jgi:hypothetical protein
MMLFSREARDLDREILVRHTCLYFEHYMVPKVELKQSEWGRHILEDWEEKKKRLCLDKNVDGQAWGQFPDRARKWILAACAG